jgi:hypothetical protein
MYFWYGILILTEQKIYGDCMIKKMKEMFKVAFYAATGVALSAPVYAQDLAESLTGLTKAGGAGVDLVFIASALIGVALMIAGGIQLKKYADNPQQNGIAKPMIYLLAGVIIFSVVATSDTMDETLFGSGGSKTKAYDLETINP